MSSVLILGTALIIYLALLYWLSGVLKVKGIWQGEGIPVVKTIDKPLINFVKGVLDFFTLLLCLIAILIPPITLVLVISQGSSATWGIDISMFSGFAIDLNAFKDVQVSGLRNPQISGQTELAIDTSNITAFYLFMGSQAALTLAGLYGVVQLRSLLISLKNGNAFCAENAKRIKRIGLLVIGWNLISPLFQYFAWGVVIEQINFSHQGVVLFPAFEFDLLAIFIGLMMIILSELFLDANMIEQDARLTI